MRRRRRRRRRRKRREEKKKEEEGDKEEEEEQEKKAYAWLLLQLHTVKYIPTTAYNSIPKCKSVSKLHPTPFISIYDIEG